MFYLKSFHIGAFWITYMPIPSQYRADNIGQPMYGLGSGKHTIKHHKVNMYVDC